MGKILAVCKSSRKGVSKKDVKKGIFKKDYGLLGDAHAGPGKRQVSLLARESLDEIRKRGMKIGCGGFGENLTSSGIELVVTQIGKTCKKPCNIYKKRGTCILPSRGIFARVLKGGAVQQGDPIEIITHGEITTGILIISDRRAGGTSDDKSGEFIINALKIIRGEAVRYKIIPDEIKLISVTLKNWADKEGLDLIITSGGTGFSPRDVTPEATKKIIQKEAPGLAEMMRAKTSRKTARAYLSRGVAGIRNRSLIINLPGSPEAVKECLETLSPVLEHAIEVMKGKVTDCGIPK